MKARLKFILGLREQRLLQYQQRKVIWLVSYEMEQEWIKCLKSYV